MHPIRFVEAHEVAHGGGNEFAAARHSHVDIRVRHNGSAVGVYDLPVNARMMIDLFLEDLEGAGLSQMSVTSTRDRRFQNNAASAKQKCDLILEIDFDAERISIFRTDGRKR